MRCEYCGKELKSDAIFCTACGKKQEKLVKKITPLFCTNCGNKLKEGDGFCTSCGAKVETTEVIDSAFVEPRQVAPTQQAPTSQAEETQMPDANRASVQKSSGNSVQKNTSSAKEQGKQKDSNGSSKKVLIIVVVIIFFLLLCALGFMFLYNNVLNSDEDRIEKDYDDDDDEDDDKKEEKSTEADEATTEAATEATTEAEEDKEEVKADYDLTDKADITIEGTFSESNSGDYIIKLAQNLSFKDGDTVLEDIKSVRIDMSDLDYKINDHASKGDVIKITGQGYTQDDKVYIKAKTVLDDEGKDISETEELDGDYIIENSSRELLTEDDIKDLSLKELNYAKNEIYARHGRKFASKELQDYFNSKDWYSGTIEPEDFSDYSLNDVELANAKLLKDREYSIDPNGYPLDK